jgi:hypothetical protein
MWKRMVIDGINEKRESLLEVLNEIVGDMKTLLTERPKDTKVIFSSI